MGQKVNPISLRLKINKVWTSQWYADKKKYAKFLHEDFKVRKYIKAKLYHAGISRIDIERASNKIRINVFTARPGLVIGKKGAGIDELKMDVQKLTESEVFLNIQDVRKPEIDAQLVAENIAAQLEKRVSYRRAIKRAIDNAFKFGAKGIKVLIGGRIGGAEIAREEQYMEGRVPLHTLKADIAYGAAEAKTTYGLIGLQVMIYRGDTYGKIGQPKFISSDGLQDTKFSKRKHKPAAQV